MFRTYGSTLKTLFIVLWTVLAIMTVVKAIQWVDRTQSQISTSLGQ